MISLSGRNALVTGAGQGIGRGCALRLASAGANVIVNDIDATAGRKVVEEIRALGRRAELMLADVSDEAAVKEMAACVADEFGSLHILVNNAGFNLFKGIEDTSLSEWSRILAVDLNGVYLTTRALLSCLAQSGSASVINIASVHAQLTIANMAAYAAAKGAVVALTRSLCQELGPKGIRVNSVSPGFIQTPLLDRWLESETDPEATLQKVNGYHPLGRIGTTDDVGNLIAFLACDLAAFITGANILIDGGLSTRLMH